MRILFSIALVLIFFSPSALAGVELEHEGIAGFWFPDDTATEMLKDLRETPLLRQKSEKLGLKISKQEDFILLLKQDIEVTEKISDKWEHAFNEQVKVTTAQQKYYEKQLAEVKKWYRSPILWTGVGLVVGAGLSVGISYALADAYSKE